jgi:hypothetical protein
MSSTHPVRCRTATPPESPDPDQAGKPWVVSQFDIYAGRFCPLSPVGFGSLFSFSQMIFNLLYGRFQMSPFLDCKLRQLVGKVIEFADGFYKRLPIGGQGVNEVHAGSLLR